MGLPFILVLRGLIAELDNKTEHNGYYHHARRFCLALRPRTAHSLPERGKMKFSTLVQCLHTLSGMGGFASFVQVGLSKGGGIRRRG